MATPVIAMSQTILLVQLIFTSHNEVGIKDKLLQRSKTRLEQSAGNLDGYRL